MVAAANGEAAIELIDSLDQAPDIAVLDAKMPGASGSDVFEHLRAAWPNVPVIFASGYEEPLAEVKASTSATEVYTLVKPFDGTTLLNQIAAVLGGSALPRLADARSS